jgi:hypothetical protein
VPLRGDAKAINVNWFIIEIVNHAGEATYRNGFVTDLPVSCDTVAAFAAVAITISRNPGGRPVHPAPL